MKRGWARKWRAAAASVNCRRSSSSALPGARARGPAPPDFGFHAGQNGLVGPAREIKQLGGPQTQQRFPRRSQFSAAQLDDIMEIATAGSPAVAVYVTCPRTGDTLCNTHGTGALPDLRLLASKGRPASAKKCVVVLQPEGDGLYSLSVAGCPLSSKGPLLDSPSSRAEFFSLRFEKNGEKSCRSHPVAGCPPR